MLKELISGEKRKISTLEGELEHQLNNTTVWFLALFVSFTIVCFVLTHTPVINLTAPLPSNGTFLLAHSSMWLLICNFFFRKKEIHPPSHNQYI